MRFTINLARYISNFAPPTGPFPQNGSLSNYYAQVLNDIPLTCAPAKISGSVQPFILSDISTYNITYNYYSLPEKVNVFDTVDSGPMIISGVVTQEGKPVSRKVRLQLVSNRKSGSRNVE